ncbi:MAG: DUF167 domain-containing protein [bacterium]|nr:DUF167 domain-containing protein [bacterium]MDT8367399.1 DUF167 domain-containing protein [bacterium]
MNDISSARISVKVKPRASRELVEGWKEDVLVVRLTSPPVEGAANSSLIRLLAKKTGVPRSRIRIVSGEKGRSKVLEFEGVELQDLRERLT